MLTINDMFWTQVFPYILGGVLVFSTVHGYYTSAAELFKKTQRVREERERKLEELITSVASQQSRKFENLETQQSRIFENLENLEMQLKKHSEETTKSFGMINERHVRSRLAAIKGPKYSESFVIHGIVGVCRLVIRKKQVYEVENDRAISEADVHIQVSMARTLCRKMLDDQTSLIAIAWLIFCCDFSGKEFSVLSSVIQSNVLSEKEVFQILKALISNNMKARLARKCGVPEDLFTDLARFLGQKNPKRDVDYLTNDDGLGLSILVNVVRIKSLKEAYDRDRESALPKQKSSIGLKENMSYYSFRRSIDIDVRGDFSLSTEHLVLSVGEIKSSLSSTPKAKGQLGLVEQVAKYITPILLPHIKVEKVMVNKTIYLPKEIVEKVSPPQGCVLEYV
jgi:hypothetical protein